ncbi:phosphodiester glycosidase family protein [Dysgonomonas sp. Marseille-P4677]|uniref:phosphodiester glycosidase family protein n=1 Tax=Dysgonomonas sp. Marseille-P4677 TaxID=2364790 RepID=UPI001914498E|nr:phosphodiester glycosidase family protein [Dysgonomonas sp. Marseille-P4677]MBK5721769.1 phosphodiester glycosidase family protein [Dysgonomonas sp. Marseille-P4677]
MKYKRHILLTTFVGLVIVILISFSKKKSNIDDKVIYYVADNNLEDIAFYWKDGSGNVIGSIQNLKTMIAKDNKELVFAMNGGMFRADNSPQGLYIDQFKTVIPLDTSSAEGNFYLKPNGVFYITSNNTPFICKTEDFIDNGHVKFATQSGPMLVINGEIHPDFKEESTNLHIRNGVGILPDNRIFFVMSKAVVNLYDFANFFQSYGCKNALYLDGYVSRAYIPEKNWMQTDGNFGVIIGITAPMRSE